MNQYTGLEIAIIGMAGRFPGAGDIKGFWHNLESGVESISFFTEEELLNEGEDPAAISNPAYIKANAIIQDKEYFDAPFFKYRPDEARLMDPQMRLFHQCVWEALEDAGCDLEEYKNKIGLFAGASGNLNWEVYAQLINKEGLVDSFSASQLSNVRFMATRIAYLLNLRGPSLYIDTACSTSLVAIHQACRSLILADCNIAVAGGVTLMNKSKKGYMYKEGMIFSKDGHCRAFDANSSGTIGGEGAAVVVLKTLKNALKDGDNIWAIIKGSGVNNDGNNKVGFTAPSIDGQAEAIMTAQKWAKTEPGSITLVEAHGTATKLGDPIEVAALNRVFGESKEKYCALGSVKTNVGHLDAAAGAAGFIKAVLAVKNRKLPPSLHYETPNPEINFTGTPFYVNTTLKEWKNEKYPLRAGVSSFGIGGTNAHVIIEEAPVTAPSSKSRDYQLLIISAKTPAALERNSENIARYIKENNSVHLPDAAYTMQVGRMPFAYRKMIVCSNAEEAVEKLNEKTSEKINAVEDKSKLPVVFMFPGQGAQYINMCYDIYKSEPRFKEELEKCFEIVQRKYGKNLRAVLFTATEEVTGEIHNTENTQPIIFSIEYALARLLISWGIEPATMIGHSIGEYVAACISGVISLADALSLVVKRGELMQKMPGGSMLSISITEKELEVILNEHTGISLAAVNSTELCVVSGDYESINSFKTSIEEMGYACSAIRTSHAFHSHMMDGILSEFENEVRKVTFNPLQIPFISNLTGKPATGEEIANPQYWVNHLRQTVRYADGIETILKKKSAIFIEVGPGKTLCSLVRSNKARKKEHEIINLVRHSRETGNDNYHLLTAIGKMWLKGIAPRWEVYYENERRKKISLPAYSFDKIKFPVNVDAFKLVNEMIGGKEIPLHLINGSDATAGENALNENAGDANPGWELASLTPTENELLKLWQHFFGKPLIGIDDDFFEIGGDSLKALTMTGRILKKLNVEVPISEFFKRSSVRKLAAYIEKLKKETTGGGEKILIPKSPKTAGYLLSSAQKRLYFLHQFDKTSLAYNMPQVIKLEGELDSKRLTKAINKLVARHESLRTTFEITGEEPVQEIATAAEVEIQYYNRQEGEISQLIQNFIRPFELNRAPLMRVGIIQLSLQEHLLLIDVHHIISDGVSQGIYLTDLVSIYNDEALPVLHLQYKDYAEWQQGKEQQEKIAQQKYFWKNEFSEEITPLEMPADYLRPAVKRYEGSAEGFEIDVEQTTALRKIAATEGTTLFMVVLSLYNILLSKLCNQDEIVIGTTTAGRQNAETEKITGMFVNTLALRNKPAGEKRYTEFLQAVKNKTLACFDNQAYQYEDLVDELKVERDPARNPLFDVLLSYQDVKEARLEIAGLVLTPYNIQHRVSPFDLTLWTLETSERLIMRFEYSTALFKKETIEKKITFFKKIVTAVIDDVNRTIANIHIITGEEKQRLVNEFNNTKTPYPAGKTIHALFEEMVLQRGEKTAVSFAGTTITYTELNERSNQVARKILAAGAGRQPVVGIMMHRSHEMIIGIMAVLKAGCAYLPIDPAYPVERISYMITESELELVLTEPSLMENYYDQLTKDIKLIDVTAGEIQTAKKENVNIACSSTDLAYLIYTSGSTGKPKGVMIEHKNVVNFSQGVSNSIEFGSENTILCLTTISFDIFVLETLVPLMRGMKIILAGSNDQKDPQSLAALIKNEGVNMLQLTPSHLKLLLSDQQSDNMLKGIKTMMVGGEAFPPELLSEVRKKYSGKIYNMYGPTETTVWSAICDLTDAAAINIGQPIANTTIRILDKNNNLLPVGYAGELCIGGEGVARGYWKNEMLTGEKFIPDPVAVNEVIYRTGDLARWLPDGKIEYLRRMDHQVKIRGYRIEVGEIENRLAGYEKIKEAVVVAKELEGDKYLAAYYVSGEEIPVNELREYLSLQLPGYMVPACFVQMESMPLTPNGKINRKALPEPGIKATDEYVAPCGETEEKLAEIWSEVLKINKELVSATRSFFELGGHSLKATVLVNKINKCFAVEMPLKEIFNRHTIESIAGYLDAVKQTEDDMENINDLIEITI